MRLAQQRSMLLRWVLCILMVGTMASGDAAGDEPAVSSQPAAPSEGIAATPRTANFVWHFDYREAMEAATESEQSVVVCFIDPDSAKLRARLREAWGDERVTDEVRGRYRFLELPTDYVLRGSPGKAETDRSTDRLATNTTAPRENDAVPVEPANRQRLLDHPAFAELKQREGIAVIDLRDPSSRHFHHVVSILPLDAQTSVLELRELLQLPVGTLSQRTLILAIRTHPESPSSARHEFVSLLADECESHAEHQAQLGVQGHHGWETRFHRIRERLGVGLLPQEVCAESWPGQSLWEAAKECVRSWRHSPGHWDAVRRPHRQFGYDMKRGPNGVWYGVGIFGRAADSP